MISQRFDVLDTWRGISAVCVAIMHFHITSHFANTSFIANAWLFVDFFFVLSGFVISHAARHALDSPQGIAAFMLRRFGRLWPLHACILLAFIALSVFRDYVLHGTPMFNERDNPTSILTNIFLLQGFGLTGDDSWNAASWSIGVEFWTYLIFAVISYVVRQPQLRIVAYAVLFAASAAALLTFLSTLNVTQGLAFFRCTLGFFAGCLVYQVHLKRPNRSKALEIASLALVGVFVCFGDRVSILAPLVFGFSVWTFAAERGPISAALRGPFFGALGRYSYSIYMVHELIIRIVFALTTRLSPAYVAEGPFYTAPIATYMRFSSLWVGDALVVAFVAVVVATSAITFVTVERPARDFFNKLTKRPLRRSGTEGEVAV